MEAATASVALGAANAFFAKIFGRAVAIFLQNGSKMEQDHRRPVQISAWRSARRRKNGGQTLSFTFSPLGREVLFWVEVL